jgi:hypothetical protein
MSDSLPLFESELDGNQLGVIGYGFDIGNRSCFKWSPGFEGQ